MNATLKFLPLLLLLIFTYKSSVAQKKPDTLVIKTKKGQIILISDTLKNFNNLKVDSIIRVALEDVNDSLSEVNNLAEHKRIRSLQYTRQLKKTFPLRLLPSIGLGTVRDKLSPILGLSIDFAPQRQDYYYKKGAGYTFINLAINSFFTFQENETKYTTFNNVFIEGTLGNRMNNKIDNGLFTEISAGVGYLLHKEGIYYGSNTIKLFANIGLKNSFIKVRPEVYITDNFQNLMPGISIKLF